jgi:CHAD domain-containing protein
MLDDPAAQALFARLAEAEHAATQAAREALAAEPFQRLMLRLAQWLETGAWLESAKAQAPLGPMAAALLRRQAKRLKGMRHRLAGLSDPALHELRIEVKKLRYAADFLGSLAPTPRVARDHEAALGRLQNTLGEIHDRAQAEATLALATGPALLLPLPAWQSRRLATRLSDMLSASLTPRAALISRARKQLARVKTHGGWHEGLDT